MALAALPTELLDGVLGLLVPYNWNIPHQLAPYQDHCICPPKCLAVRLVCSKFILSSCFYRKFPLIDCVQERFDSIVSYHALRKLRLDNNFDNSHILNSSTIQWLLATKFETNRHIQNEISATIWNSISPIALWRTLKFEFPDEKGYLNAACGVLLASQGRQWAWEQLKTVSNDRGCLLFSDQSCSDHEGNQEPSTQHQWALQAMAYFRSLHVAAYYGDGSVVQTLLENDFDPNLSNDYFGSALYAAAYSGHVDVMRLLIRSGADVDVQGFLGTPFVAAAHQGHAEIMQLLLDRQTSLYPSDIIQKCLLDASLQGHVQVVRLLLEQHNVDVNTKTSWKETPLLLATANRRTEVAKLLLSRPDVQPNLQDGYGYTALHWASLHGLTDLAQFLLSRNDIDPNLSIRFSYTPLSEAVYRGHGEIVRLLVERDDVRPRLRGRYCPVREAVRHGHAAILENLLDRYSVDLKCRGFGEQLFKRAVLQGHGDIVSLLLERDDLNQYLSGTNVAALLCAAIRRGHESVVRLLMAQKQVNPNNVCPCHLHRTLLGVAIYHGSESVVQSFLERKDVHVNTLKGQLTPLCIAAKLGKTEMVRLLLKRPDLDLNMTDQYGKTPLLHATCRGNESTVSLLLKHSRSDHNSVDVNKRSTSLTTASVDDPIVQLRMDHPMTCPNFGDLEGWTPLLAAVVIESNTIVELLMKRMDTDPNSANSDGWTALLIAANNGNEAIVRRLLRHPEIRPDLALHDGSTPLMLAQQRGHDGVVRLLMEDQRQG